MKGIFIYWMTGCVLLGVGAGLHETRCPNDKYPSAVEFAVGIAVWPAGVFWAITNLRLPACERHQ